MYEGFQNGLKERLGGGQKGRLHTFCSQSSRLNCLINMSSEMIKQTVKAAVMCE